jgi:orc1/cdc6 family replication initiation protein
MITNARVLQDDFLPNEVVHRHTEMNRVTDALEPVVEDDIPEDAFLVGPSGAGKTCIARYSLEKLQEERVDIDTHYVDCWQHSNRFRALYKVLEGVESTYDVHRSTPHDEMIAQIEDRDQPYIVILDEVDQLADTQLLKQLYSIPEVTMLLICNRERDLYAELDERLQSRIRSSVTVTFDAYTHDEIFAILSDRVKWGLADDVIEDPLLEEIATAAEGNARDAISILRSAARAAERDGTGEITARHVKHAVPEARAEIRQKNVDKLNDHQQHLYEILRENGGGSPGELYAAYREAVEDPRTKRTVRSYLQKLEHYNLAESSGSGPSRSYNILET